MTTLKPYNEENMQQIISDSLNELGYELVRVKTGSTLQIMAERKSDGGMDITDCENISRYLSPILDNQCNMPNGYVLEVSSPGIDRPLVKLEDFDKYKGHMIKIKTKQTIPQTNSKKIKARLIGINESEVLITANENSKKEQQIALQYQNINEAKLLLTNDLLNASQNQIQTNQE